MRLLNVRTLKLEEHFDVSIPHYSILSHTWGAQEVVYSHIRQDGYKAGSSSKVDGCIAQAIKDGLDYVWIDTCCIDKSSSAELSEAINSIFAWYWGCVVCYACLVDVPDDVEEWDVDNDEDGADINSAFAKSRWFTRGWTLQELLAPDNVVFFSVGWLPIGRKLERLHTRRYTDGMVDNSDRVIGTLPAITGIAPGCLDAKGLSIVSAAQKMSWAAGRKTTRREDRAYSLLGIFGVNMPMLYGEGDSAFARLQEEILRLSDDQSLLAWGYGLPPPGDSRLLARTTDEFSACGHVCRFGLSPQHYTMTNKGLQISWLISDVLQPQSCSLALLHCGVLKADNGGMAYEYIVLPLRFDQRRNHYRDPNRSPMLDTFGFVAWPYLSPKPTATYLSREIQPPEMSGWDYMGRFSLACDDFDLTGGITECYPQVWEPALKQGRLATAYIEYPLRDTMLFLYTGRAVPPFVADVRPGVSSRMDGMSCNIAWMPSSAKTLAELILQAMARKEGVATGKSSWYEALNFLEYVHWGSLFVTQDGTSLSARVAEDNKTGKSVIRFEKRAIEAQIEAVPCQPARRSVLRRELETDRWTCHGLGAGPLEQLEVLDHRRCEPIRAANIEDTT